MADVLWNLSNPTSLLIIGLVMMTAAVAFLVASAARRRHDYRQLCGRPGPALVKYLIGDPLPPSAGQAVVGAAEAGAAVAS